MLVNTLFNVYERNTWFTLFETISMLSNITIFLSDYYRYKYII